MNKRVAERMNFLLRNSEEVGFESFDPLEYSGRLFKESSAFNEEHLANRKRLYVEIYDIALRYVYDCLEDEIVEAAKERREAVTYIPPGYPELYHNNNRLGRKIALSSREEVLLYIGRDNARRLEEYERYRLACEQGVAVAPESS